MTQQTSLAKAFADFAAVIERDKPRLQANMAKVTRELNEAIRNASKPPPSREG